MTVLFAGGEEICFTPFPTHTLFQATLAGRYDSNYCRGGLTPRQSNGWFQQKISNTALTETWVHFEMSSAYDFFDPDAYVSLIDSTSGNFQYRLVTVSTINGYEHRIEMRNAANSTSIVANSGYIPNTSPDGIDTKNVQFDLYCKRGAAGILRLFVNEQLKAEFLGDTTTFNTGWDTVLFTGFGNTDRLLISQVIVADEDTRLMKLKTLIPDGVGDVGYASGNHLDINEFNLSLADFTTETAVNATPLSTVSNLLAGDAGKLVKGVSWFVHYEKLTGGSPPDLKLTTKVGATIYLSSTQANAVVGVPTSYGFLWTQNPATNTDWTFTQVNNIQLGIKTIP